MDGVFAGGGCIEAVVNFRVAALRAEIVSGEAEFAAHGGSTCKNDKEGRRDFSRTPRDGADFSRHFVARRSETPGIRRNTFRDTKKSPPAANRPKVHNSLLIGKSAR